jgi:adenylate kinase
MRIVLVGPPGAGKGTQAVLLAKRLSIPHISTGEMIRGEISSGSELGTRVKAVNDRGELVSDKLMKELVRARLAHADCKTGFLLDGYPRTVPQVADFDEILSGLGVKLDTVIEFSVPQDVLIGRVKARAATKAAGAGRADDDEAVAAKRLQVYEAQTAPLLELLRPRGIVRRIDGIGSVDEVSARISAVLR